MGTKMCKLVKKDSNNNTNYLKKQIKELEILLIEKDNLQIKQYKELQRNFDEQMTILETENSALYHRIKNITKYQPIERSSKLDIPEIDKNALFNELSRQYIENAIDDILSDPNINISILPDYYERRIYRNVFNTLFGLLDYQLKHSHIEILGHRIKLELIVNNPNEDDATSSELLNKNIKEKTV